MTALSLTLAVARLKLRLCRLLATRAAWRTVRRILERMAPGFTDWATSSQAVVL
jgi:hypothetical protein